MDELPICLSLNQSFPSSVYPFAGKRGFMKDGPASSVAVSHEGPNIGGSHLHMSVELIKCNGRFLS